MSDPVNHPSHYNNHPSGIECIDVVEHMGFNLGNAIKYMWRAGDKDPTKEIEDLKKAQWYVNREIFRLSKKTSRSSASSESSDSPPPKEGCNLG